MLIKLEVIPLPSANDSYQAIEFYRTFISVITCCCAIIPSYKLLQKHGTILVYLNQSGKEKPPKPCE